MPKIIIQKGNIITKDYLNHFLFKGNLKNNNNYQKFSKS